MTSSDPPRGAAKPPARSPAAPAAPAPPAPGSAQDRWERRDPFKARNIPSPVDQRAHAYARFIPREELSSFAAWSPSDLAGGTPQEHPLRRATDPEPPEPEVVVEPVVDTAAMHAAELHAARQGGYHDGYRDGLVALDGFKQSFALQTTTQIGGLLHSIGTEFEALEQEMARSLAAVATTLARQIVRSELVTRPALIAQVAQEAIETLLLSAKHITLRVHPDDQAWVAQGAAEVLAARGARLLPDASITRGGCLIESDIGVIDASLENRWRRAAASLGCDDAWGADAAVAAVAVASVAAPSAPSAPIAPAVPAAAATAPAAPVASEAKDPE